MRRCLKYKIIVALLAYLSGNALAIEARCSAEFGGKTITLTATPVNDPYLFVTDDALAPFRVSVQYLGEGGKLKMYAYHDSKDRLVLIHAAQYQFNEANCNQFIQGFGLNKIYSAKMEKELVFQCFAVCR